jgi:hypothetical protein
MGCTYNSGETGNAYRILVDKLLGKWSLIRPKKWEDNIKMDLSVIGCKEMNGLTPCIGILSLICEARWCPF